jgi:hypothetical protein
LGLGHLVHRGLHVGPAVTAVVPCKVALLAVAVADVHTDGGRIGEVLGHEFVELRLQLVRKHAVSTMGIEVSSAESDATQAHSTWNCGLRLMRSSQPCWSRRMRRMQPRLTGRLKRNLYKVGIVKPRTKGSICIASSAK